MGHGPLDQVMRNGIKESFDVQIDDPVGVPAALPRHPHRVERRLAGSVAIRVGVEVRIHHGSSTIFTTVCATRSATVGMPRGRVPPLSFVNLDEPHGRRKVRARRHPIPDLVEVVLQVLLECRQRLAIHARSAPRFAFTRWYASQTSCFGIT